MLKSYENQILDHNDKKFCLMKRFELNMFFSVETLTQTNHNIVLQVNSVSRAKKIMKDLKYQIEEDECRKLQNSSLNTNN